MKQQLKSYCHDINLDYVGIVDVGPFNDLKELLRKRQHHNCGLENKDLDKQTDPKLTMPHLSSIIVALFPYYTEITDGNLSNYTYSRDYHLIVREKLNHIGDYLKTQIPDFQYQAFVDTGPLVDRYLAYKAGLGFYGINSHLINDDYGSYFFIGYMMNNYPFEPDTPLDKTCYRCMQCVKACPGQIILGNYDIDAKGCRSYLTQKKGELTEEEIMVIQKDKLIFGCDICQRVCPHNRQIKKTPIDDFKQELLHHLTSKDLEGLSNKEFKKKYGNRAFSWRGKKLLLRNMDYVTKKEP